MLSFDRAFDVRGATYFGGARLRGHMRCLRDARAADRCCSNARNVECSLMTEVLERVLYCRSVSSKHRQNINMYFWGPRQCLI